MADRSMPMIQIPDAENARLPFHPGSMAVRVWTISRENRYV